MLKSALGTFFISLFTYAPIFAQTSKIDSTEMLAIRIDPQTARGARVSEVFHEVNFIPLETTTESLFGKINQLETTENHFIIYDDDTHSVLIFNRTGKFISKITGKDAHNFQNFSLKYENKTPFIEIFIGPYYLNYDLNGKLIRKILSKDKEEDEGIRFTDHTQVKSNYTVYHGKDTINYEIGLSKDNKEIANYFPYNKKRSHTDQFYSQGGPIHDSKIPDEFFFTTYYDNNIYRITPKKISLAYRILFPGINTLPTDFISNPIYKNKREEYFRQHPQEIFATSNLYKIGDFLYLKYYNWDTNTKKYALRYNLKTADLTSVIDLEPDSSSSFLPITDAGFHLDFANKGFLQYDGKYLYTSYSSLAMFAFKELSASKNPKYDALLTSYFKTENRKSNPVIIQLKPKKY